MVKLVRTEASGGYVAYTLSFSRQDVQLDYEYHVSRLPQRLHVVLRVEVAADVKFWTVEDEDPLVPSANSGRLVEPGEFEGVLRPLTIVYVEEGVAW